MSLIVSWALPWKVRFAAGRRWAAVLAVVPHVLVILLMTPARSRV